jgi:hypothetical protein
MPVSQAWMAKFLVIGQVNIAFKCRKMPLLVDAYLAFYQTSTTPHAPCKLSDVHRLPSPMIALVNANVLTVITTLTQAVS